MLARAVEFLGRKGVEESRLDAELLVAHALGLDRLQLFLQLDRPVAEGELAAARALLVRRAAREPVAYLTGAREFYGRPFAVDARVLIPRPETELLVDIARERAKGRDELRIADFGTGSGCVAITLALEIPGARVVGLDASEDALAVARANAESLGAAVELVHGDGPEAFTGPFDLVVANPPYIAVEEAEGLQPEVRDHEPRGALFAPADDPDHWVRRLSDAAGSLLSQDGVLLVELGFGQAERARRVAEDRGLAVEVHDDLARIPRVLEVRGG